MERAAMAKEELQHNNNGAGRKDMEEVTNRSDDNEVNEKLAITGARRQKALSTKSSCGDAEALGKLEVVT